MQKTFTFLMALCLGCTAMFAGGKGDNVNARNVFSGKLLTEVSGLESSGVFTYNEKNQLVSYVEKSFGWTETITFDYVGGTVDNFSYDVKMTISDDGETQTLYIAVGDNNFASSVYEVVESNFNPTEYDRWSFEYNAEGQLTKMTRSEGGNEVSVITYADGNISSVSVTDDESPLPIVSQITYGDLSNVGGLMFFDLFFGIDMDEMDMAYFAGLLGKPTRLLPVAIVDNDDFSATFAWTAGADNYPVSLKAIEEGEAETINFTWSDEAGISGTLAESDEASTSYDLQGLRLTAPERGLSIVRHADGKATKILRR